MEDKDIKDVIDKESLAIPSSFSQRIDDTLSALPSKKTKRRNPIIFGAIAAIVLLMGVSATVSDTFADTIKNIPFLGAIFEEIGDSGLNQASKQGLATEVNETISTKNISITITDVIFDGTRLSIAYVKQSNEEFAPDYMNHFVEDLDIFIDGKLLHNLGMGIRAEQLDDHTIAGVVDINTEESLKESFTLTLKMREIDEEKGNWKISIPIQKIGDGKTILLHDQKEFNNTTWKLVKATLTPATTKISFNTILPIDAVENNDWDISYQLLDDKGIQVRPLSGHASGSPLDDNMWINKSSAVFAPVSHASDYLIFQAIMRPLKEAPFSVVEASLQNNLPIELEQGDVGKLVLTKMEYTETETLVYFTVYGSDPYRQTTLWFVDQNGNTYRSDDVPEKLSEEVYNFVVTFPLLPSLEQLTAVTVELAPPKVIEELRFKIPIK
ncbi:DUF4179 domain-containing protein [Bacillus sp. HMF5848]|uniref:DUF4179 domain-containing protein n=1 Tax=Bacillus sp. HMF5848 TaxID=2495421 RepID=UPI000F79045B|nr:DUF4179 domain-containing protein [Bacillus sp. HMF5848]RSK27203.1 DUF4179 domain-containing protein [Bacillus sp. HMF5848]